MTSPDIETHIGIAEDRLRDAHDEPHPAHRNALARMAGVHVDLARLLLDRDRYAAEYEQRAHIGPEGERRRREMTTSVTEDRPRRRS